MVRLLCLDEKKAKALGTAYTFDLRDTITHIRRIKFVDAVIKTAEPESYFYIRNYELASRMLETCVDGGVEGVCATLTMFDGGTQQYRLIQNQRDWVICQIDTLKSLTFEFVKADGTVFQPSEFLICIEFEVYKFN